MGRYINVIQTGRPPAEVAHMIQTYLNAEGFKQIDPARNIWKKGMGLLLAPQNIQFDVMPGQLQLQAWIQFALFPGVYIGEVGIDGLFMVIPKRKLKARVVQIEQMVR